MSSNPSPTPNAGDANPYSREGAPGQGLGETPAELGPDEIAAAAAWASSLNSDGQNYAAQGYADPYQDYPPQAQQYDPYAADPYATPPYADPYAAYSPYAGQHPAANPYAQANPYAVQPAQGYGMYGMYQSPLQNHPMAVPAFVLSMISYVICPLLGVVGMFMGISALNGVNSEPEKYTGKGLSIAAIVLGALTTLGSLFFVIMMAWAMASPGY